MSEIGDHFRAIADHRKEMRRLHGVTCPMCPVKRPRAHPSILMPGQQCKVDGYVDPRPEVEDRQT